jgi:hypothetical protein
LDVSQLILIKRRNLATPCKLFFDPGQLASPERSVKIREPVIIPHSVDTIVGRRSRLPYHSMTPQMSDLGHKLLVMAD